MKVLIHKETGMYGHYMGNGEFAESTVPQIFPDTMNRKAFIDYVLNQEGVPLNINNWEVKNVEIIVFDEVDE